MSFARSPCSTLGTAKRKPLASQFHSICDWPRSCGTGGCKVPTLRMRIGSLPANLASRAVSHYCVDWSNAAVAAGGGILDAAEIHLLKIDVAPFETEQLADSKARECGDKNHRPCRLLQDAAEVRPDQSRANGIGVFQSSARSTLLHGVSPQPRCISAEPQRRN